MIKKLKDSHQIPEQRTAYRRGMVLGLTMAEVGILIIFVLLLLIGFQVWGQSVVMRDREAVKVERLTKLEKSDSILTQLRDPLQIPNNASVEEISTLIRTLRETTKASEGQTALQEARSVIAEMSRIREEMKRDGVSEDLTKQIEQQSYRIANQEGQLQHYESRLKEAGLGKGERPCWVNFNGQIEYLYDVVLGSSGIRMREYHYEHRERERSLLPMTSVDPNEFLSPEDFLIRTQAIYNRSISDNCRYFVVIYDNTGQTEKELYKKLLRTVEGHFYKYLNHGPAPF